LATHNELGKKGELIASQWLLAQGYEIIHKNWRHAHVEIDIIATKEILLHFIEVKSRSNNTFGYPEESISEKKMENLLLAADEFLFRFPQWKRVQYDVLSINITERGKTEFFLIEDIYL
jgi:putative endonuclease